MYPYCMKRRVKEIKSDKFFRIDSEWVSTTYLKCMDQDFLLKKIKDKQAMPRSIGIALVYLLKNGYIRVEPTQRGHDFARRVLEVYDRKQEEKSGAVVERRRMRSIAMRSKFILDKITARKDSSVIYGHYKDGDERVDVEAFTYGHYITLRKVLTLGDISSFVGAGKLYNKIQDDIVNALRSPEGKLWLLKVGSKHIKRYLQNLY